MHQCRLLFRIGKKVILYFYPKDNTPGCTKQACGFSERYPQFTEKGAVVLGVSKDSVASHKKFVEKYGLVFTLLADPERTAFFCSSMVIFCKSVILRLMVLIAFT